MSIKYDIEKCPWAWSKELVSAVEDYKNGKRNSKKKLRKIARLEISEHYYNELITRYAAVHRTNKENRNREISQKIKSVLLGVAAFIIIAVSGLCTLAYLATSYGKSAGFWYFLLSIWAFEYVLSLSSKEEKQKIENLERENEQLENKLAVYKSINIELEAKLEDISNNTQ